MVWPLTLAGIRFDYNDHKPKILATPVNETKKRMALSPTEGIRRPAENHFGTRRVVMLGSSPAQMLDIVGPLEVFSIANRVSGLAPPPYRIELASTDKSMAIAGTSGLFLKVAGSYGRVRGKIDTLLIAGGEGARMLNDKPVLAWIRTTARRVRRVGSVCTGAFVLAKAGVLNKRRVTTHWAWTGELQRLHPEITVDHNPIWVRDGNVYTSAGITAGIDLAIEMVAEDLGSAVALRVAQQMVVFLHRPGGQAQFSISLARQGSERKPFRDLGTWMIENLAGDLSITALAARVGMSARNFCRVFPREMGTTPGRYLQSLKIEAARRGLEQNRLGLKELAAVCGFGSEEVLRCAFLRELKTTPGAYRKRFQRLAGR